MNYMDWPTESVAYYGPAGGLIPIPIARTSSLKTESSGDRWVTRVALSGRRVAQRLPRQRRDWGVELPPMTDDELGSIKALQLARFTQPCAWVTPDMKNLVTPEWATFDPWKSLGVDVAQGGPINTGELLLPGSGLQTGILQQTVADSVPVRAGTKVTGSCWVAGSNSPYFGMEFLSATGTSVGWSQVNAPTVGLNRLSITATAPASAATCRLAVARASQVAGQQVEWGDEMTTYSTPQGCISAVIQDWSEDLEEVSGGVPWWSYSFSVQEIR